jgi:hypothetical protein
MNCPLCQKELVSSGDTEDGNRAVKWMVCPTQVWIRDLEDRQYPHCYISQYGDMHLYAGDQGDYRVYTKEDATEDKDFRIARASDGHAYLHYDDYIIVPPFEIKSEEQLLKKLRTILVFS